VDEATISGSVPRSRGQSGGDPRPVPARSPDSGGRGSHRVRVRIQDHKKNGAAGAVYSQLEDESRHRPRFHPMDFAEFKENQHHQKQCIRDSENLRVHSALSFIWWVSIKMRSFPSSSKISSSHSDKNWIFFVLSDRRWVQFPPSVWAAAATLYAMGQHWDETQHILDLLQVSKVLVHFNQSLFVF